MTGGLATLEGKVRLQVVRKGDLIQDTEKTNDVKAYARDLVLWGIINEHGPSGYPAAGLSPPAHGGPTHIRCTTQTATVGGKVFGIEDASLQDIATDPGKVIFTSHDTTDASQWVEADTAQTSSQSMDFDLLATVGGSSSICADFQHDLTDSLQLGDMYRVIWTLTVGATEGLNNFGCHAGAKGLLSVYGGLGFPDCATVMGQSNTLLGDNETVAGLNGTNGAEHVGLGSSITGHVCTATFPVGTGEDNQWKNTGRYGFLANGTNILGANEWDEYDSGSAPLYGLPANSARVQMTYTVTVPA